MQPIKISESIKFSLFFLIVLLSSINSRAQYGNDGGKDNTPRSIWDKEPEPQEKGSLFGSPVTAQDRLSSGMNQAGTTTLAGPGALDLQGGANGPDGAGVPIDGGLGFLLAAGAGYGVRKIRKVRKKRAGSKC